MLASHHSTYLPTSSIFGETPEVLTVNRFFTERGDGKCHTTTRLTTHELTYRRDAAHQTVCHYVDRGGYVAPVVQWLALPHEHNLYAQR